MQVAAGDGRTIEIRRRGMPWKLRKRDLGDWPVDPFGAAALADDPAGFVVSLVVGLVLFLVGGIIISLAFLVGEFVLLLVLLVPLFFAARMFWVLPWVIEVKSGDALLGLQKVRGWRASEERIQAVAAAYQQGVDPFAGT